MKKLLSILLTLVLAFSLCGYRLVIDVLQQQQEAVALVQIDKEAYTSEDLISLKVPVSLPYYTNSAEFQYIKGEVQMDGMVYRYVKRRIYNDSIEYLCLKDMGKTKLVNAREQFYQLAYDLQTGKTNESSRHSNIKPLMLEYCALSRAFALPPIKASCLLLPAQYLEHLTSSYSAVPAQPPEHRLMVQLC